MQKEAAIAQREAIKKFVAGTVAGRAPIVPISAQLKYNVDVAAEYLATKIPIPGARPPPRGRSASSPPLTQSVGRPQCATLARTRASS